MNKALMKEAIMDYEIPYSPNQFTMALNMDVDDTMKELLTYIIYNEPITLYRVSKNTRFAISTVYKKARKMMQYGLIRPLNGYGSNNEKYIYESTVKGLLTCLALNCIGDSSIILSKICRKWRLRNYCCQRIMKIMKALMIMLNLNNDMIKVIEDPKTIMISILEHRDQLRHFLSNDELNDTINIATHYLISRLIIDGNIVTKSSLLVGNEKFVVSIDLDGNMYVYMCKLCEKSCMNVPIPYGSCKCILFNEIRKLRFT
ncbi:MAG: hypothetical protein ACP5GZ_09200 [Vulcanisaeta sp.]|uniref:hypothetical protein n=1 Tax=Vulcanisaeta sp. TaxID=2020871 RepID=UPI003D098E7C